MGGSRDGILWNAQAWCKEAQLIVSGMAKHLGAICTVAAAGLHQHQPWTFLRLQGPWVKRQRSQVHGRVQQRYPVAEGGTPELEWLAANQGGQVLRAWGRLQATAGQNQ
jgi:hypothetical protein